MVGYHRLNWIPMSIEPPHDTEDGDPADPPTTLADSIRSLEQRLSGLEDRIGQHASVMTGPLRDPSRPEGDPGKKDRTKSSRYGLEARTWWRFVLAAVALSVAWSIVGVTPFLIVRWLPRVDLDRVSSFGQTFQVAESFFSALSVAGVAYALVLQARDQADARRQASKTRHQADASEARSAELGLLASLVQARAALVRTSQAAHEEERSVQDRDAGDSEGRAGEPSEGVKQISRIRKDQLAELLALIDYAERVSGWAGKKAAHLPTPLHGDEVPEQPALFRRQGNGGDAPG